MHIIEQLQKKVDFVRNRWKRPCDRQRWRRGHNLRGQGLWKGPRLRPRTELPRTVTLRPRTERLEDKDSRARLKILKIRANINVNIVIMISQAFKRKIV